MSKILMQKLILICVLYVAEYFSSYLFIAFGKDSMRIRYMNPSSDRRGTSLDLTLTGAHNREVGEPTGDSWCHPGSRKIYNEWPLAVW